MKTTRGLDSDLPEQAGHGRAKLRSVLEQIGGNPKFEFSGGGFGMQVGAVAA